MEVVAGIAALVAGVTGLGLAFWLAFLHPGTAPDPTLPWIAFITAAIACGSLTLARRLLSSERPPYLVSWVTLAIVGFFLLYGALTTWRYEHDIARAVEAFALSGACFGLALTRYGRSRTAHTRSRDAT